MLPVDNHDENLTVGHEKTFPPENLALNLLPLDAYFGPFLQLMRRSMGPGCSEFGFGINLFSLAVSIKATNIIEIGRFKGFSTLCLASALRFLDAGWQEPSHNKQRPDVDYYEFERSRVRRLFSIDPFPNPEAAALIAEAELTKYVAFIDARSEECALDGMADLILIDGDHRYEPCRRDVMKFVPEHLRPGGYFILHDYFGWYDENKVNQSPIKAVVDEVIAGTPGWQHLLVDTGYMSFVIFRKPSEAVDG